MMRAGPLWRRLLLCIALAGAGHALAQLRLEEETAALGSDVKLMERRPGPPRVADGWCFSSLAPWRRRLGRAAACLIAAAIVVVCAAPATAQVAASVDYSTLASQVEQLERGRGLSTVADAWLLANLGRAELQEDRYANAEIRFNGALVLADGLHQRRLKQQVEILRSQWLAAWHLRSGRADVALQQLALLPAKAGLRPQLTHAVRAAACAELRDGPCLKGMWPLVFPKTAWRELWSEEVDALDRFSASLERAGLAQRSAAVHLHLSSYLSDETERLRTLVDALSILNDTRVPPYQEVFVKPIDTITGRWLRVRPGQSKPGAFDDPDRTAALMQALAQRATAALHWGESDLAAASLQSFDRVMEGGRLPRGKPDALERLKELRWALEGRSLASNGGYRQTLHAVLATKGAPAGSWSELQRFDVLASVYRRMDIEALSRRYVQAMAANTDAQRDAGFRRQLAIWHASHGDVRSAWQLMWPSVEMALRLSFHSGLSDSVVQEDVLHLGLWALHSLDPQMVAAASGAIRNAALLVPDDPSMQAVKGGLAATAGGDTALWAWADGLAIDTHTPEHWRATLLFVLAQAPWVNRAAPARAIGWLNAAASHRPSDARDFALRSLAIAQTSSDQALIASAWARLKSTLHGRTTPFSTFLADAVEAQIQGLDPARLCDLRARHAALGRPVSAVAVVPALASASALEPSSPCAPLLGAELSKARAAFMPSGALVQEEARLSLRLNWPRDEEAAATLARELMAAVDGTGKDDLERGRTLRRLALEQLDALGRPFSPAALVIARHSVASEATAGDEAAGDLERLAAAAALGLSLPELAVPSAVLTGPLALPINSPRLHADRGLAVGAPVIRAAPVAQIAPITPTPLSSEGRVPIESISDEDLAVSLGVLAREVIQVVPDTTGRDGRPVVEIACNRLDPPRPAEIRRQALQRSRQSLRSGELAYRVSQIELFCGQRSDSEHAFRALQDLPGVAPRARHTWMAWRVADLANRGDLPAARLAAADWARALEHALAQQPRSLSPGMLAPLLEDLAFAGDPTLYSELHAVFHRDVCRGSLRDCATLLLPGLRLQVQQAEATGGAQRAMEVVRRIGTDKRTLLVAHRILTERIAQAGVRRPTETALLVDTHRELPPLADEQWAGMLFAETATIHLACWRESDAALALSAAVHRARIDAAREEQKGSRSDSDSRKEPSFASTLQSAAALDVVLRALRTGVPDADDRWRRAGLPFVDDVDWRRANLIDAARAWFRAGEHAKAMALLKGSLPALVRMAGSADGVSDLANAVAQHLILTPSERKDPAALRVLHTLVTLRHPDGLASLHMVGGSMRRLLAEAYGSRGNSAVALQTLLTLHADAVDSNPAQSRIAGGGQTMTKPLEAYARFVVEDLRSVVDHGEGARFYENLDGRVDELMLAERRLGESQRAWLAQLLVESGGRIGLDRSVSEEMAFGIMQSATVGPTALDLSQSLLLAGIEDAAVWEAMVQYHALSTPTPANAAFAPLGSGLHSTSYSPPATDPCSDASKAPRRPDPASVVRRPEPKRPQLRHGGAKEAPLVQALKAAAPPAAVAGISIKAQTRAELETFLQQSAARHLGPRTPVTLTEVRRRLCPGRALYLVTTHEAESYGFLVTCAEVRAHEVRLRQQPLGEKALTSMIQDIRRQIADRQDARLLAVDGPAAQLHDALFGPWKAQLATIEEITIVARGPLEELPFGVLPTPRGTDAPRSGTTAPRSPDAASTRTWFGARYAWSFGLVGARADDPVVDPRAFASKPIVQIGPPRFTGTDPCNDLATARDRPLLEVFCNLSTLESLGTSIAASLPGTNSRAPRLLLHDSFSRERLQTLSRDQTLRNAGVLIVATHGLLASQAEQLGGKREPSLLIAGGPKGVEALTATDIAALSAGADEIVLASCHTAAGWGDGVAERGFSGLVRAFLRAGGRNVVAALYDVNADTTGTLLEQYFAHRAQGLPPPRALQAAVRRFGERGELLASPWAWAGLVHIGPY